MAYIIEIYQEGKLAGYVPNDPKCWHWKGISSKEARMFPAHSYALAYINDVLDDKGDIFYFLIARVEE